MYGDLTQIGTHGKVGDTGHSSDASCDIMKETVTLWFCEGEPHEGKRGDTHYGADCKVPVRTMGSYLEVGMLRDQTVGVDCLIARHGVSM